MNCQMCGDQIDIIEMDQAALVVPDSLWKLCLDCAYQIRGANAPQSDIFARAYREHVAHHAAWKIERRRRLG